MAEGSFATAINCVDGRVQVPVMEYMQKRFGVEYVDVVTEAGVCKSLSNDKDDSFADALSGTIKFLAEKHGSKAVAIVGHHDCAGNPSSMKVQHEQILASVKVIESWGLGIPVVGLWVGDDWQAEEVCATATA